MARKDGGRRQSGTPNVNLDIATPGLPAGPQTQREMLEYGGSVLNGAEGICYATGRRGSMAAPEIPSRASFRTSQS
jgi:hypothetical protein